MLKSNRNLVVRNDLIALETIFDWLKMLAYCIYDKNLRKKLSKNDDQINNILWKRQDETFFQMRNLLTLIHSEKDAFIRANFISKQQKCCK